MKRQIKWTLQTGKKVTYSVELQLEREINCDGDKTIVPCCEFSTKIEIEGINTYISSDILPLTPEEKILFPNNIAKIGKQIGIKQPQYDEIMHAITEVKSHPKWIAKQNQIKQNEKDRTELNANRKKNGYCYKCHSYCFGDCKA